MPRSECDKKSSETRELQQDRSNKAAFLMQGLQESAHPTPAPADIFLISFDMYFLGDEAGTVK